MDVRRRVMVVEDNPINRAILRRVLAGAYDLVVAENGLQALDMLTEQQMTVHAILLDLVMPVMDGYTFLEKARTLHELSAIPVLVMTQNDTEDAEIRALKLGASDFIAKPYKPAILKQRLNNMLLLSQAAALRNTTEQDPLTHLYNRTTFYTKAALLMARGGVGAFDVITCDLQRFKIVNDLFGTAAGDQLLIRIGETIAGFTEPDKRIAARLSGDCFALCTPHEDGLAQRLADALNHMLAGYPMDFSLRMIFGVYPVENTGLPVSVMCDRANLAVASIKGSSEVTVAVYSDGDRRRLLEEQEILNDMRTALAKRQFEVFIQPKFDLADNTMVGGEALIRWRHPVKGLISPAVFIPIFEKNGFVTTLDAFVWEEACRMQREWLDRGLTPLPISINVSRVDVYNPNTPALLSSLMARYRLPFRLIELEITESAYRESPEQLIEVTERLKKMGFTIDMDDFGSGYSSLNMLNEVPVDVIKLDMNFLRNSGSGGRSGNIINSVINMAKWLGLSVIAEGVETAEQAAFLRFMGCSRGQGYLFSRPLPKDAFEVLWQQSTGKHAAPMPPRQTLQMQDMDELWKPDSRFNLLFNDYVGALAVYEEQCGGAVSMLRANDRYYTMVGAGREAVYRQSPDIRQAVHPDDRARFSEGLHRARDTGAEYIDDVRCFHPETHALCWRHLCFRAMMRLSDRTIFFASVEDVTAAHLSQERLHRAEEETARVIAVQRDFYQRVFNALPGGILQCTGDGRHRLLLANRAARQLLGIPEDYAKRALNMDDMGLGEAFAAHMLDPDGRPFSLHHEEHWLSVQLTPAADEQEHALLQAAITDETECRESLRLLAVGQEALRRRNDDLARLCATLPCGMMRLTAEAPHRPIYANRQAANLFGYETVAAYTASGMPTLDSHLDGAEQKAYQEALRTLASDADEVRLLLHPRSIPGAPCLSLQAERTRDEGGGNVIQICFMPAIQRDAPPGAGER